jgi:hypothetical protein
MELAMQVDDKELMGLLCCALEGGSNYWIRGLQAQLAKGLKLADFGEGGKFQDPKDYWHWSQIVPFHTGCSLLIAEHEKPGFLTLNKDTIAKGLQVFQKDYPRHFGNFLSGDDDAETGDVFLQCCLFGELVYG